MARRWSAARIVTNANGIVDAADDDDSQIDIFEDRPSRCSLTRAPSGVKTGKASRREATLSPRPSGRSLRAKFRSSSSCFGRKMTSSFLPRSPDNSVHNSRHKRPSTLKNGEEDLGAKVEVDLGETVTTVVVSSDKSYFAAGAINKMALVCDMASGNQVAKFTADGQITASVFGGEGPNTRLIVGSFSGMITVFHIGSNRTEHVEKFGNGEMITCMAIGANSTRLAVAGKTNSILLYTLNLKDEAIGMNVLRSFDAGSNSTLSICLDARCETLVAGGESKIVCLWQVSQRWMQVPHLSESSPLVQFRTATTTHSVTINASGTALAVGTSEHTEIYRIGRKEDTEGVPTVREAVWRGAPFLRGQARCADFEGYLHGEVNLFCEPLQVLQCPATHGSVAFSKHSQIAIGGNHNVYVFDVQAGGMLVQMTRNDRVRCVAISSDGQVLLIGGFDKKCLLLRIDRGSSFYDMPTGQGSTAKSVHLSPSSTLLAVGLDVGGMGAVQLFDAMSYTLKHVWEHPKAMWAVRISADSSFLAAGGWDMALTLYSTITYAKLQEIKWSPDVSRLALGCWDKSTYIYALERGSEHSDAYLHEISTVKRDDRVYAVALNETGGFVAIGGRDKRVALYDIERGERGDVASVPPIDKERNGKMTTHMNKVEAVAMWDVLADDFVYCVALTSDMQYVCYGGTAKKVVQAGVIWSVAVFQSSDGWKLAIGGELPVISVINIETRADELQLPVGETTFDISMRNHSIGFCNGPCATMFGAGGTKCSWQDTPSFQVLSGIVMSLLSVEEQLLRCVSLIVQRHPAVVNARDPATGKGVLHFIIERTNQPELLALLLNADAKLGLPRDNFGRSPVQLAVQHGKWHSLRLLLDALIRKRFSITPGPMSVVCETMRDMAYKYPLDFLHFISATELQPEPEVLGEVDASDVMLNSRLLRGSELRCPRGMWNIDIKNYLKNNKLLVEELQEEAPKQRRGASIDTSILAVANGLTGANVPKKRRGASIDTSILAVASVAADAEANEISKASKPEGNVSQGQHRNSMRRLSDDDDQRRLSTTSLLRLSAMTGKGNQKKIPMGYSTVVHTGLQAFRVPFEDFAALGGEAGSASPLKLIVDAVSLSSRSGEAGYSVFGSLLVEILIEYKWNRFARRKYTVDILLYLAHVVIILIWNISSQSVLDQGLPVKDMIELFARGDQTLLMLTVLWTWTTGMCIIFTRLQLAEMLNIGFFAYIFDPWNALEVAYVVCQLSVNVLFLTHHQLDDSVWRSHDHSRPFNLSLLQNFQRRLEGNDAFFDGLDFDETTHRMLRGSGGGGGDGGANEGVVEAGELGLKSAAEALHPYGVPTGRAAGAYVILQALVALTTWTRLMYYFKGILRLGTLVHTLLKIVVDIYPLLILIVVIFIAFWSSIWMLIQVELEPKFSPEWHSAWTSIIKMFNMGLYTDFDQKITSYNRDFLLVALYQVYMFIMQIVLLNLLIALMAESNERVRSVAKLVAQFERAKLILQWERRLSNLPHSTSKFSRFMRIISGLPSGLGSNTAAEIFPKWLHVLMPPSLGAGDETGLEAASLKLQQEVRSESQENFNRMAKVLATVQQETKKLGALVVETQEKHGNALRDVNKQISAIETRFTSPSLKQASSALPAKGSAEGTARLVSSPSAIGISLRLDPSIRTLHTKDEQDAQSDQGLTWLGRLFAGQDRVESKALTIAERSTWQQNGQSSQIDLRKEETMAQPEQEEPPKHAMMVKPERKPDDISVTKPAHAEENLSTTAKVSPLPKSKKTVKVHSIALATTHSDVPIPKGIQLPPSSADDPGLVLQHTLKAFGSTVKLELARKAASSLRDPEYTLRAFHDDIVQAFPEIQYYMIVPPQVGSGKPAPSSTSSFRSSSGSSVEYLRTIGAFAAIYWLSRIGMDGEDGFSFGVDEGNPNWPPNHGTHANTSLGSGNNSFSKTFNTQTFPFENQTAFFSMSLEERAETFRRSTPWMQLADLMVAARLMASNPRKREGPKAFIINVDRMIGMLALTAFHDIMKMEPLLPTVQVEHAPYVGFRAGDRIKDHAIALGYIMEHYGHTLPSYAGLPEGMQRTLRFTQVKLAFNHGWLMQAEAPPGPLFAQLRGLLLNDKHLDGSEISFYFFHWLTDLAGAEPTPLRGSEKLVLKFPHHVLWSFVSSFSLVPLLVEKTETQVLETLLNSVWAEAESSLGTAPSGPNAIALLRLVAQVQYLPLQQRIVSAWQQLRVDNAKCLGFEMALTGISGQAYDRTPTELRSTLQGGPAFLVYDSPAFLRKAARSETEVGLRMLADIYSQARSIWPFSPEYANQHVTIRIDQMREHSPRHIMEGYLNGEGWLLVKRNEREAVVEYHSLYMLADVALDYRVLAFWERNQQTTNTALIEELEQIRMEQMDSSLDTETKYSAGVQYTCPSDTRSLDPSSEQSQQISALKNDNLAIMDA